MDRRRRGRERRGMEMKVNAETRGNWGCRNGPRLRSIYTSPGPVQTPSTQRTLWSESSTAEIAATAPREQTRTRWKRERSVLLSRAYRTGSHAEKATALRQGRRQMVALPDERSASLSGVLKPAGGS